VRDAKNLLIYELANRAWLRGAVEMERRRPRKPGEFLASLSEEEREALRGLKSSDLASVRPDAVPPMLVPWRD